MLVTIKFKDTDIQHCDNLEDLTFKLEGEEIAVYKGEEKLGYFSEIIGISAEEFLKYVQDSQIEII